MSSNSYFEDPQSTVLLEGIVLSVRVTSAHNRSDYSRSSYGYKVRFLLFPAETLLCLNREFLVFQVMTQADLGLADAYINGDFSFVDKDRGLLNLFQVIFFIRWTSFFKCCILLNFSHA